MKPDKAIDASELRRRAEEQLQKRKISDNTPLSAHEVQRLLHELQVHQIELEMQNEALRHSMAELEASQERLADLYDFAPVGYCVVSEEEVLLEANLTAATLLGVPRGELIGQPISRFILAEDRDTYSACSKRLFERKKPQSCEVRLTHRSENPFWAQLESAIAEDDSGTTVSRLILSDISERKKIEEELQHRSEELAAVNRELEAFSYSVSHDLRSPLRAISNFLYLLRKRVGQLDEESDEYIQRAEAASKKMDLLINDMLRLSSITRKEMVIQEIDLSAMAKALLKELNQQNPEKHVVIHIPENLKVKGDASLIKIALTNLLENAWKYTEKNSEAHIEFDKFQKNGKEVFFIRDNGAGFPMDQVHRLFQPFQRLHSKREFSGTGIGLPIVYRVINRHGGEIWAKGEVGKGAIFYFTLGSRS